MNLGMVRSFEQAADLTIIFPGNLSAFFDTERYYIKKGKCVKQVLIRECTLKLGEYKYEVNL
jgi:hypothetical protein